MKPHRATLILVLGILSLIACQPLGIAAWIMGSGDLKQMNAGTMDPEGKSLTNAGRICGMIAICITVLGILVYGLIILLGVGAAVVSNS